MVAQHDCVVANEIEGDDVVEGRGPARQAGAELRSTPKIITGREHQYATATIFGLLSQFRHQRGKVSRAAEVFKPSSGIDQLRIAIVVM